MTPWKDFTPETGGVLQAHIGIGSLLLFLALVLLFRCIPAILLLQVGKIILDVTNICWCNDGRPWGVHFLLNGQREARRARDEGHVGDTVVAMDTCFAVEGW